MNTCDPNVATVILGFAIGGITLRVIVAQLKDWLKVTGILALLLTLACSALAVIIYMAFTGFNWTCFLFWTFNVFTGTQVAYRLTH